MQTLVIYLCLVDQIETKAYEEHTCIYIARAPRQGRLRERHTNEPRGSALVTQRGTQSPLVHGLLLPCIPSPAWVVLLLMIITGPSGRAASFCLVLVRHGYTVLLGFLQPWNLLNTGVENLSTKIRGLFWDLPRGSHVGFICHKMYNNHKMKSPSWGQHLWNGNTDHITRLNSFHLPR